MATSTGNAHPAIIPLNGTNFPMWKLQYQMALMKDGLWGIVSEAKTRPTAGAEAQAKFDKLCDKALAIIVLSIDTSLLYLIREPVSPVDV